MGYLRMNNLTCFFRNLTNELREIDKVLGLPSILSFFSNEFMRVHVVYIQSKKRIEKRVHLVVNKIKATVRTVWHMAGPLKTSITLD